MKAKSADVGNKASPIEISDKVRRRFSRILNAIRRPTEIIASISIEMAAPRFAVPVELRCFILTSSRKFRNRITTSINKCNVAHE